MSSHSTAKTAQILGILFPLLIIYFLSNLSYAVEAQDEKSVTKIGAIIDVNSRIGKQQKAAMEVAAENFNSQSETHELILHFRDSGRDPFIAAYAAEHLMKEEKVQVIIGMETWQEAVTVADVVKSKNLSDDQVVPVISFAAPTITPPLILRIWPFLIRMGSDVTAQMDCIGDIVSAYYWKRVVVIYEDDGYGGGIGRLALLSETLRNVGAKIEHRIVLPRLSESTDPYWDKVAEKQFELSNVLSRVFIVLQSSLPTVTGLFKVAKKMGLVGADSAWIITESIASLLDPQGNHDMEATLGIKTYYNSKTTNASFQKKFRTKYTYEDDSKPGIYALRAYDIISIITKAISKMNTRTTDSSLQESLAERLSNYKGLSGKMQLKGGGVLLDSPRFRIINIVDGKTDKELNFWTPGFGFQKSLVNVSGNLSHLYSLPHEFHEFNGNFSDLIELVNDKTYDAIVGDMTIAFSTWFTFSSLFFAHREKVYSNLTRIVFIVWLFVVLILSSSYTANLSSMLTIRRLSPNVTDIEMLRRTNSLVGCDKDSFVRNYLENVLGFNRNAVVVIKSSCEPEEIRQKNLSAVFLELPYAQVFMDKHKGYTLTQPTYNFGGFSFVFQKGSPITRDFSKIILDLLENGEVRKLQNQWLTSNNRPTNTTSDMPESLSLKSFWGLFVISGATSTFCLLIALAIWLKKLCHQEASQGI
ncbi:hypothetical protein ACLB2K_032832 [Fragaria x ananassa]